MTPLQFMNDTHKDFFFHPMTSRNISFSDHERAALFYTLGLMADTRNRIHLIYNDERSCIRPEVLRASFQTSGTLALTRLAFMLYNDYEEREPRLLQDITLYHATVSGNEDEVYTYTDDIYTEYFTGLPYFNAVKSTSFLSIFCNLNRSYVPFLFEAIKLRLNMVDIVS